MTQAGPSLLDLLRESAKQTHIDDERLYIVEGDLLLDEDQIELYARQREALNMVQMVGLIAITQPSQSDALVGIAQNGRIVRWHPHTILTYCILKNTFVSEQNYQLVRDNMRRAATEWEQTCGVRFEHRAEFDNQSGTTNPGVLFMVRGFNADGNLIASAFFPNDSAKRRQILIDPSYFVTHFDKVGVLRHELGHVLGFRHEHIRSGAPPDCPDERLFGATPLTAYDPKSVMHYFCGGVGSKDLAITEVDRQGAQKVYGPPLDSFIFIEP